MNATRTPSRGANDDDGDVRAVLQAIGIPSGNVCDFGRNVAVLGACPFPGGWSSHPSPRRPVKAGKVPSQWVGPVDEYVAQKFGISLEDARDFCNRTANEARARSFGFHWSPKAAEDVRIWCLRGGDRPCPRT